MGVCAEIPAWHRKALACMPGQHQVVLGLFDVTLLSQDMLIPLYVILRR